MNSLQQLYFAIGKLETLKARSINIEDLNFIYEILDENEYFNNYNDDDEHSVDYYPSETVNYSEFSGTYAREEAGLSDDFINSVLGGEPEAYWNID